jgi:hypothetical protein
MPRVGWVHRRCMRPADLPSALFAGPFTTATARQRGVSGTVLAGNRVRPVLNGVHELVSGVTLSERDSVRRLVAAAQLVIDDAVASCTTACLLWGLPIPLASRRVHVCSGRQVRRRELVSHRRRLDGSIDLDGAAVTTPVRTFIDVGLEVGRGWHLAIGDTMVQRGLLTTAELRRALTDMPSTRGILAARRTAALVRSGSESPMESLLRWSIVADGLPEPAVNGRVLDEGGWLARVDLSYPDRLIAIEYQGDQHRSDKRQWRRDIGRTRTLQAAGWLVIFASADDIARPHGVLASIRAGLTERGWRPEPS